MEALLDFVTGVLIGMPSKPNWTCNLDHCLGPCARALDCAHTDEDVLVEGDVSVIIAALEAATANTHFDFTRARCSKDLCAFREI